MALLVHERWAVYSGGLKQNHLDIHPYGCDGYLSTFISFKPEIAQRYWLAITANDMTEAVRIIRAYEIPFFNYIMALPGGFDAGMHGMLEVCGIAKRWRRPPFYSLSDGEMERLRDFVTRLFSSF
jgi:dihydrodipicolinate synthase/N-acetylneuraminate lyase